MCKAFQDLMKEERRNGKREGKREEKLLIIHRMIKSGCDEVFINKMTNCTKEEYAAAVKLN